MRRRSPSLGVAAQRGRAIEKVVQREVVRGKEAGVEVGGEDEAEEVHVEVAVRCATWVGRQSADSRMATMAKGRTREETRGRVRQYGGAGPGRRGADGERPRRVKAAAGATGGAHGPSCAKQWGLEGEVTKERVREVEDKPNVWAPHSSGIYEKDKFVNVNVGPACQGFLSVKS
jgi:hypothetical protein